MIRYLGMLASLIWIASAAAEDNAGLVESPTLPYVTLMLVRDPAVHQDLHLSRKQIQQVEAAVSEVDHPLWVLRDVPVAQCREKLDEHLAQLRGKLPGILTAGQIQRLDQVIVQARGLKALASQDISTQLSLSEEQVGNIRTLLAASDQGSTAGNAKTATPSDKSSPRASPSQDILGLLNADQSTRLTELVGKPFPLGRIRQIGCQAPDLQGVESWINSDPVTLESQRGKVVAVHFWAFGCINCIRNLPHYQSWFEKFPKSQLTIIGIHTPETDREKSVDNLRENVRERGIAYPVAFDAAAENWKAWGNHMWPSVYLIDKQGRVRNWWYGELNWQGASGEEFMRKKIAELAAEK